MTADPVLKAAQDEAEMVTRLTDRHARACPGDPCETCASLAAHAHRTRRQVALLTPADIEEPALFPAP